MLPVARALPSALLWDVDGTLCETEEQGHRLAFNRAFREAGLPWSWDPATYRRLLAVSGGRERLAGYLRSVEGVEPAPERLDQLVARKQVHYGAIVRGGSLGLRGGVERLIREAAAAGVPQVIVTTSSRGAVEALMQAVMGELGGAFCFWICGEEVAAKKPDPQAYLLALARLEGDPERMVVLEDSGNGLAAARGAGLACLVTLSSVSAHEPLSVFAGAAAVVDGLGDGETPASVHQGPPCPGGQVTLAYLERLLDPP